MDYSKKIFILLLAANCFQANLAAAKDTDNSIKSPFSGFSLIGSGGVTAISVDIDGQHPTYQHQVDRGAVGAAASIAASFDYPITQYFLLGTEIDYLYNWADASAQASSSTFTENHNIQINNSAGVQLRLSFTPTKNSLYYLGFGPQWVRSTAQSSGTIQSEDKINNRIGLTYTVGAKQMVYDKIYIQEQLSFTHVNTFQADSTHSASSNIVTTLIGVGYVF